MIRTPSRDLSEPRTVKVTLPIELHLRLHSLKILSGTSISKAVEDALRLYLDATAAGARGAAGKRGDASDGTMTGIAS